MDNAARTSGVEPEAIRTCHVLCASPQWNLDDYQSLHSIIIINQLRPRRYLFQTNQFDVHAYFHLPWTRESIAEVLQSSAVGAVVHDICSRGSLGVGLVLRASRRGHSFFSITARPRLPIHSPTHRTISEQKSRIQQAHMYVSRAELVRCR